MRSKTLRTVIFTLHRWLGLLAGLVLVVVGLTGSVLVFAEEIRSWVVRSRFGVVIPQAYPVSIDQIVIAVQTFVRDRPELKIDGNSFNFPAHPDEPLQARLWVENDLTQIFINPYTGTVMGEIRPKQGLMQTLLELHYQLLGGQTGQVVVGVAALILIVLSLTGLALWPGWRKPSVGFKVKWDAHAKRLNFDLHKVVGIVALTFLIFTGFTGFCWNFYEQTGSVIRAVTFSPAPPKVESTVIPNQPHLPWLTLMQVADTALPGTITYLNFPDAEKGVLLVGKRQSHEHAPYGETSVLVDQYSGKVLQVKDSRVAALGDRVLNSFTSLHYGAQTTPKPAI